MSRHPLLPVWAASAVALANSLLSSSALAAEEDAHSADIQTVVVTGSPITTDPDYLATIVESAERDDILRAGGANIADALANVPGVTGSSFAAGASRPVIRGFDANRVRTLEDGVGSFDVSDVGPDHGVPLDPLAADKVEVVRGAATMRYGSQAIGGVVNTLNGRVPHTLPEDRFGGEVTGAFATNANTREGSARFDARAGQFAFHVDGFGRDADSYDTPEGVLPNSYFRGDGAAAGGSYFFGKSYLGAALVQYNSRYGIPGEDTYIDMQQTKELFRSSFAIGRGALRTVTVDGGHADYEHSERDDTGAALATFKDREWDIRAEAIFGESGFLSASALGFQAQRKQFSALGEAADYLQPTVTKSQGVFGFTEIPTGERLRLQLGARLEQVSVDGTPVSDVPTSLDFTPISASVGLVAETTEQLTLGMTLSSAARAPAQTELFARGPHDGPATFETGDPTLDLERANSIEGTVRVRGAKLRFDGAVWGAKFANYIYGELTGRTCNEEGDCVVGNAEELKEMFYTQRDANFWGAEAKVTATWFEGSAGKLESEFLADFVRATLADGGGNVPRLPPYRVGGTLNWRGETFDGGVSVRYSGRQDRVGVAETETAGFTTVEAQFGWRPLADKDSFEVVLVGRNLTDSVRRNSVALNKDDILLPGRDLRLMLRAAF